MATDPALSAALQAPPFWREAGTGPSVLCLHSNASSSSQWRALMELLAPDAQVLAPDQLGAGRSAPWPAGAELSLCDEVERLAPVMVRAGPRFHVVGHSYGAALAVRLALTVPDRVASMVLFEPTLFTLLRQDALQGETLTGIAQVLELAGAAVERGDLDAAARHFIDYWMGPGSWAATPEARRGPIAASMGPIRGWSRALVNDPATLADMAALRMPVLLLGGATSTAAAKGVLHLLQRAWPAAECQVLPGVGHMGPVTHAAQVNALIQRFLLDQPDFKASAAARTSSGPP